MSANNHLPNYVETSTNTRMIRVKATIEIFSDAKTKVLIKSIALHIITRTAPILHEINFVYKCIVVNVKSE